MPVVRAGLKHIAVVPEGGTVALSNLDKVQLYMFHGGVSLLSDYIVEDSGSPVDGMEYTIMFNDGIDLNGNTVTVFGENITQDLIGRNLILTCIYNAANTEWIVFTYENLTDNPTGVEGTYTYEIFETGGNLYIDPRVHPKYNILIGNTTLIGNFAVAPIGTYFDGDEFTLRYEGNINLNGYSISLMNRILTSQEALAGDYTLLCKYDGTSWHTSEITSFSDTASSDDFAKKVLLSIEDCDGLKTIFSLNHGLGDLRPSVTVFDNDAEDDQCDVLVVAVDENTIEVRFSTAPQSWETFDVKVIA